MHKRYTRFGGHPLDQLQAIPTILFIYAPHLLTEQLRYSTVQSYHGISVEVEELLSFSCLSHYTFPQIWNAETGIMKFDLQRRAKPVYSLALRSCGKFLVFICIAISCERVKWVLVVGNVLAAGSWGGFVTLWSLVDGSVVKAPFFQHMALAHVVYDIFLCR